MRTAKRVLRQGRCQVCRRRQGQKKLDRFGWPDSNPTTPLGAIERCEQCGTRACPDCLVELDCCQVQIDLGERQRERVRLQRGHIRLARILYRKHRLTFWDWEKAYREMEKQAEQGGEDCRPEACTTEGGGA